MITRRNFLLSSVSAAALCTLGEAQAAFHGSIINTNTNVVVNYGGASPSYFSNTYLNIFKQWTAGSSQSGWPGLFGGTNNYPNGNFTSNAQGAIYPDPTYYGHYILSWTDTGGTGVIGNLSDLPAILYSGGNGTATVFGISPAASGVVSGNLGVQSGGSGANIEFAYGMFLKAVKTDSSQGPANIAFTTAGTNYASAVTNGMTMQFNNLTGLPAGPNPDGSWTIYAIDSNNFGLLNSSSVPVAGITLNTSGIAGTNTEAIYSVSSLNRVAIAGNWTGANASNIVLCKKADLTDINNGVMATQSVVSALKGTKAAYLRFMDLCNVQNIQNPDYAHRVMPSNLTWGVFYNPIAYWGGVLTNASDTFTAPINPSASPASGAYVDGEKLIVQVGATASNTTQTPKLGIAGRAAAMPLYDAVPSQLNLTFSGSVPPSGTTLSMVFTGGGLASPFTYTYTTSTTVPGPAGVLDTNFTNLIYNIRQDLQHNTRGNSGPILAAGIYCLNGSFQDGSSQASFYYNPNINSSGVAQLGAGFSITGNDPTSSMTLTFGYMPVGYMPNNSVACYTFSALLQGWVGDLQPSGYANGATGGPPLEFYAELCARCNSGMWLNVGMQDSPTTIYNTVLNLAQATYNGQPAIKSLAVEYGNETWNNRLGCYGTVRAAAAALGISATNGGGDYSAHGLRVIQMAQQATAAWAAAGRARSQLKIVNAYQFINLNSSGASATSTYRFNGSDLNASASGTNVTLKAFGGPGATAITTDYSTAPNRPIDWTDWISPATYWQGTVLNAGSSGLPSSPLSYYNNLLLNAYNYAYGNSTQQQTALDWLCNNPVTAGDMYNGNGSTSNDPYTISSWAVGSGDGGLAGCYGVGTVAASYDTSRSSTGTSGGAQLKVGVACYEGGWVQGPRYASQLASSLTSLGYTNGYSASLPGAVAGPSGSSDTAATASTNIYNFFVAWQNDARSYALTLKQFDIVKAAVNVVSTRDALNSWYGFAGSNEYALYPALPMQGAPFQPYNAIAAWSG